MLCQLRSRDTVVVWKQDRLGRSLRDLIGLVAEFQSRGVDFVSLHDGINTATSTGLFIFNIFASLAEFEREIIKERTKTGLVAAKARGRAGGRPVGLTPQAMEKAKSAKVILASGKRADEIAKILGISRATCYRYIEFSGKTNESGLPRWPGKEGMEPEARVYISLLYYPFRGNFDDPNISQ